MSNLTQDEKRIRIAEACGWEWLPYGGTMAWYFRGVMRWFRATLGLRTDVIATDPLPDYFNDLNAAHAMEKAICDRRLSYYIELEREMDTVDSTLVISATAAQRAEAFGRTLNLW